MMKSRNQIFLYGIGGVNVAFRVLAYEFIESERFCVWLMHKTIESMRLRMPGIEKIYMIDNRPGLRAAYMDAIKYPSMENCIEFKDILEREGHLVYQEGKK